MDGKSESNSPAVASSAEVTPRNELGPIRLGVQLYLVNVGITTAFFAILGTILLIAGYTVNDILNNNALDFVGLLISMYAAFLLYRNYSKDQKALITLILTAIVASIIDSCVKLHSHQTFQLTTNLLSLATDLVAYCFGWYLAATTGFKMFLLNHKWVIAFTVIGAVSTLIGWI